MDNEWVGLAITTLLTVVIGFQGTSYYRKMKYQMAIRILRLAVEWVYKNYVRPTKDSNDDGKLTDGQKLIAEKMAVDKAQEFAAAEGIDLQKQIREEYMDLYIQQLVAQAKGSSK